MASGSPYLTGVPLARFSVPDGLGGADRYGALATSVTAAGNGADGPAGGPHGPVTLPRPGSRERAFASAICSQESSGFRRAFRGYKA
jgi:hypothetical protein